MSSVNNKQSWFFFSFQLNICIPVRMDHKCKNNPDGFCYISGNVVLPNRQAKITDFMKKAFSNYFGVQQGDKQFIPYICCKTCVENLRDWRNVKRKSMPFAIPKRLEGRKWSHYRLLFLHDKSKRNKSREQAPCTILMKQENFFFKARFLLATSRDFGRNSRVCLFYWQVQLVIKIIKRK